MQKKRTSGRKRTLSLEHLEPRILLSVVNPGEPSLLYGGDTLYFVQGEAPVGDPVPPYSDQGGTPSQVVIVDFEGTGYVTIQDSLGHSYLEGIENGAKIGNISFYGVTEDSSLYIRTGEFRQDHGLDDLPAGMADAPDTSDDAWGLAVPGGDETYNTGRRVVASLGSLSPDWYKFSAEEAERIVVNSDGLYNVDIYVNGLWRATNSYTIGDLDGDEAVDSVEVLLRVLPTGKYVLEVDRVEQTVDWDGDGTPENEAATEDFPDDLAIVTVEGFPELFYRQDLTSRMPMFNLHGEGPGDDYFSVKLAPYQTLAAEDFSPGVASVQVLHKDGWVLQDLITGDYTPSAETTVYLKVESSGAWNFDLEVKPRPLETIVQLVRDQYTGRYVWWNASATPWMNSYYSGGVEVPVSAPAGSGGITVTPRGVSTLSEAISRVREATAINPMRAEYYTRLGRLHETGWRADRLPNDFQDAFDAYVQAEYLFPSRPDAAVNLGRLHDLAGQYEVALGKYRSALDSAARQFHIPKQFNSEEAAELEARIDTLQQSILSNTSPPPPEFKSPRLRGLPRGAGR